MKALAYFAVWMVLASVCVETIDLLAMRMHIDVGLTWVTALAASVVYGILVPPLGPKKQQQ